MIRRADQIQIEVCSGTNIDCTFYHTSSIVSQQQMRWWSSTSKHMPVNRSGYAAHSVRVVATHGDTVGDGIDAFDDIRVVDVRKSVYE